MDPGKHGETVEESPEGANGWDSDDFSLSSDFDADMIRIEDGGVQFSAQSDLHVNCVDKQIYEKEKHAWEDAMNGLSQRFERATSMLESMKSIALADQKQIRTLEAERDDALKYKKTFDRLQQQIVDLNNVLYESNEETSSLRRQLQEEKERGDKLESLLYGPTNYYYQEFLKVCS